jgi:hypothetical protein
MSAVAYPAALVKAAKAILDCRAALERTRGAPKKSKTATRTARGTGKPRTTAPSRASRGSAKKRMKTPKLRTTAPPRSAGGTGKPRTKQAKLRTAAPPRASWGIWRKRTEVARRKTTAPTPSQPTPQLVEAVASAVVAAMVPAPKNKRKSSIPKRRAYASSLPAPKQARAKARDLLAHLARAAPRGSVGRASIKSRLASAIRKRSAKIARGPGTQQGERRTLNDRESKFAKRLIDIYAKNDAIVDVQTVEKEASMIRRHYPGLLPTPFLRNMWRDAVVRGAMRQPGRSDKTAYDKWMSLGVKTYPTKDKVEVFTYDPRLDRDHPDYDPKIKPKFERTLVNESVRRFRKQLTGHEDVLPLKRTGR